MTWATSPPAPVVVKIQSVANPAVIWFATEYADRGLPATYTENTGGAYTVTVTPFGPSSNSCTPASVVATFAEPGYVSGTWQQGAGPTLLASSANYLCWLTRVTGRFDGGGESVQVYQSGGYWYLGGSSEQVGVAGAAMSPSTRSFPRSGA